MTYTNYGSINEIRLIKFDSAFVLLPLGFKPNGRIETTKKISESNWNNSRILACPVPRATSAVMKSWNAVRIQCAEVCSPAISGGGPFNRNLQGATWKSIVPGVSINRSIASTFSSSETAFASKAWTLKRRNRATTDRVRRSILIVSCVGFVERAMWRY